MTRDELKSLFPKATEAFLKLNSTPESSAGTKRRTLAAITLSDHANTRPNAESPCTVVECPVGNAALGPSQGEAGNPGIYVVRIISYRQRLLDEDNLSAKYFCDGLRYAGLIPEDSPDICQIRISQKKVKTKAEQRTVITITSP